MQKSSPAPIVEPHDWLAGKRVGQLAALAGASSMSAMDKDEPMWVLVSMDLRSPGLSGQESLMVGVGIDLAASASFRAFRATVPLWTLQQCADPFFQNGPWRRQMAQALYLCCAEETGALSLKTAEARDWWKVARHHVHPIEERFDRGQAQGLTPSPLDQGEHPKLMIAELSAPRDIFMVWQKKENDAALVSKRIDMTQGLAVKIAPKIEEALRAIMAQLVGAEAIFVSGSAPNGWAFAQRMNAWGDSQQIQAVVDETTAGVKKDGAENNETVNAPGARPAPRSL